jgi:hypothetical protein
MGETSVSEPLRTDRKFKDDIETRGADGSGSSRERNLMTGPAMSGVEAA